MKMDIDLGTKGSDFDDDMESDPPPKKKAPARKAPAKKAAKEKEAVEEEVVRILRIVYDYNR